MAYERYVVGNPIVFDQSFDTDADAEERAARASGSAEDGGDAGSPDGGDGASASSHGRVLSKAQGLALQVQILRDEVKEHPRSVYLRRQLQYKRKLLREALALELAQRPELIEELKAIDEANPVDVVGDDATK